jgi:RimJ/RimL family protein N-acetyltransferase
MNYVPEMHSERILLREIISDGDSEEWFNIMKDPDMHLWTGNTVPESKEDIRVLLQNYKENENIIAWAVIDKKTNQIIGTYWIWVPLVKDNVRLIQTEAQRISKLYWRRGYTTEARKLVYNYAFQQLEVDEIHAGAWANNVSSCKSMEAYGFILLEVEKRLFKKYSKEYDENHYVLYRKVWENKKL